MSIILLIIFLIVLSFAMFLLKKESSSLKGAYGEKLTYKHLKPYEEKGARFLFNCYIPKGNGETTEIDLIMIYTSGIYVFESKNYSGWIFGSEYGKTWTQVLPS